MCIIVIYTTGRQSSVRLRSFRDWPELESSLVYLESLYHTHAKGV